MSETGAAFAALVERVKQLEEQQPENAVSRLERLEEVLSVRPNRCPKCRVTVVGYGVTEWCSGCLATKATKGD